jgi:hypothetical protein
MKGFTFCWIGPEAGIEVFTQTFEVCVLGRGWNPASDYCKWSNQSLRRKTIESCLAKDNKERRSWEATQTWCYTINNKDFFFVHFISFYFNSVLFLWYFLCQTLFPQVKIWSTLKDIPNFKDRQHCVKRKIRAVFPSLFKMFNCKHWGWCSY